MKNPFNSRPALNQQENVEKIQNIANLRDEFVEERKRKNITKALEEENLRQSDIAWKPLRRTNKTENKEKDSDSSSDESDLDLEPGDESIDEDKHIADQDSNRHLHEFHCRTYQLLEHKTKKLGPNSQKSTNCDSKENMSSRLVYHPHSGYYTHDGRSHPAQPTNHRRSLSTGRNARATTPSAKCCPCPSWLSCWEPDPYVPRPQPPAPRPRPPSDDEDQPPQPPPTPIRPRPPRPESPETPDSDDIPEVPEDNHKSQEPLEVVLCNMMESVNAEQHHTGEYKFDQAEREPLVIRRGQPFTLKLIMSRTVHIEYDLLTLVFALGPKPRRDHGTEVILTVTEGETGSGWTINQVKIRGSEMKLQITASALSPIGKWNWKVKSVNTNSHLKHSNKAPDFYLLFNAWSPDDGVFMKNEEERKEYVLNDDGYIYNGDYRKQSIRSWMFAQFERQILDIALKLMDDYGMAHWKRYSPVSVCRAIQQMLRNRNSGVITGNWDLKTTFPPGTTAPGKWLGSAKILYQYNRTQKPVKYGQCWVYAGVGCTVLRSLGVPSRVVTNFASAHDYGSEKRHDLGMGVIDFVIDEKGAFKKEDSDSIWNYHVWNDCWMRRSSLDESGVYDGWQTVDCNYGLGPTPLPAIKHVGLRSLTDPLMGRLTVDGQYAPFIYSEVNGDVADWIVNSKGKLELINRDKNRVGKLLLTSAPGDRKHDITLDYKFKEGTPEEREVNKLALKTLGNDHLLEMGPVPRTPSRHNYRSRVTTMRERSEETPEEITAKLYFNESFVIGQTIVGELSLQNRSAEDIIVKCALNVYISSYNGIIERKVASEKHQLNIQAGKGLLYQLDIKPDQYLDNVKSECSLKFVILVTSDQAHSVIVKDNLQLLMPQLNIQIVKEGAVNEMWEGILSIGNPLPWLQTNCYFQIEGLGLTPEQKIYCEDLPPGKSAKKLFRFKPHKLGERKLLALWESDQLDDVNNSIKLTVTDHNNDIEL